MEVTTPVEAQGILQSGRKVFLIDVRTAEEFREVHARGAQLFTLQQLDVDEIRAARDQGGYEEKILVICRSGARSGQACLMLNAAGIPAINISGGTMEWQAQGLPVERG
ncbi:MAG: rhodanese-like domain-containing protein [Leptospirales bacterium]|nr:rhodanese-like domain-containing protein [Leptospirales bacterium]